MTTAVAAARLGISQRQVQRLVEGGRLPAKRTAGEAWVVDALAVNALARARPDRGRPWSRTTAWAALWRLSDLEAGWLDRRTMSRLTGRLSSITAEGLVHATRHRAVAHGYRASESLLADLDARIVRSGVRAMDRSTFGMEADVRLVDGYCDRKTLDDLVARFHLTPDTRGNVTLRAIDVPPAGLLDRTTMPTAVIALDLAESLEVRERSAGLRVLEDLLR